jgi:hypothetical protein
MLDDFKQPSMLPPAHSVDYKYRQIDQQQERNCEKRAEAPISAEGPHR